jgi:hypothetical protein
MANGGRAGRTPQSVGPSATQTRKRPGSGRNRPGAWHEEEPPVRKHCAALSPSDYRAALAQVREILPAATGGQDAHARTSGRLEIILGGLDSPDAAYWLERLRLLAADVRSGVAS